MLTSIMRETADGLGLKKLKLFGIDPEVWDRSYYGNKKKTDREDLNLGSLDPKQRAVLRKLLEESPRVHGVKVLLKDLDNWEAALEDPGAVMGRSLRHVAAVLAQWLLKVPGHRLYEVQPDGRRLPYYVSGVEYHPPKKDQYEATIPAYIQMDLNYRHLGHSRSTHKSFWAEDVRGMTVPVFLLRANLEPETPELRAEYEATHARFESLIQAVGRQCLAVGIGESGLDDIALGEDGESRYWQKPDRVDFVRNGNPTKVVVDVYREKPGNDRDRDRGEGSDSFWVRLARDTKNACIDPEALHADDDETDVDSESVELPTHPIIPVFDLSKHVRLKTHAGNLEDYRYDAGMIDRLVLPPETKSLVRVLTEHEEAKFRDIVEGKSGGTVILLAGPPGTGKTLTAEVYAESEGRALYSVQCSQLGIDPDTVEKQLLIAFERARRWGAVMLLDEADVYVRERGSDLTQNAIVGVFLRVLEYQSNVLFLTTNRPDDVDDAIMSRCVARVGYRAPSDEDQARLWETLSGVAGIAMAPGAIPRIVRENPGICGRDVKQLLKLAQVVCGTEPVTPAAVSYVRRFRPDKNSKPIQGWTPEEQEIMERLHKKSETVAEGTSRFKIRRKPKEAAPC